MDWNEDDDGEDLVLSEMRGTENINITFVNNMMLLWLQMITESLSLSIYECFIVQKAQIAHYKTA